MPRGIKNTTETAEVNELDAFKSAIIELGTKLCVDVQEGRNREPIATLKEIANLYNAVK